MNDIYRISGYAYEIFINIEFYDHDTVQLYEYKCAKWKIYATFFHICYEHILFHETIDELAQFPNLWQIKCITAISPVIICNYEYDEL